MRCCAVTWPRLRWFGVNIQDGCIGHVNTDQPLIVEDDVSVGHGAIIHGCRIGRGTLIGMGAIVLNGAEIGEYALIGAGALVTENKIIPPRTLVLGTPARVVRELTEKDLERMRRRWKATWKKDRNSVRASIGRLTVDSRCFRKGIGNGGRWWWTK